MNVLEILLNRRWILKSRDRELYNQGRKNACCAGKLDGDFGL